MKDSVDFDAAQRTIEQDSTLMARYMETDQKLSVTRRITAIFIAYIKYNPRIYHKYLAIKEELERAQ